MGDDTGREPGGWELLRAVNSITARIDDIAKGFVPIALYNVLVDRVKEVETNLDKSQAQAKRDVDDAKSDAATQLAVMRTELDNAKKSRAQTWTSIGLLAGGGAAALLWDIFRDGLGI